MNKKPRSIEDMNQELTKISDDALQSLMSMSFSEIDASPVAEDEVERMEQGTELRATVVAFEDDDVLVEFGKSTGSIPRQEFGGELPQVGDIVCACYERYDSRHELAILSVKEVLREVFLSTARVGMTVEGRVSEMNKGGLVLLIKGQRAFMPISQVSLDQVDDLAVYLDVEMEVEITEVRHDRAEIVVSRRAILNRQRADRQAKAVRDLQVGQEIDGHVRQVNDFGAFVDLGGCDGLLHMSKIRKNKHLLGGKEMPEVGQHIKVLITHIDIEQNRIGLDFKEEQHGGWEQAKAEYLPGDQLTALVSRVREEGAYLLLESDVEGFLPAAELVEKPVKPGSLVSAIVQGLDEGARKVLLKQRR